MSCPIVYQGHLSNFKVTWDKKSPILIHGRFQTVTPVWIHRWLWNDAQILKKHRRGAFLFFKVICQISISHGTKLFADAEKICWKIDNLNPIWVRLLGQSQLSNPSDLPCSNQVTKLSVELNGVEKIIYVKRPVTWVLGKDLNSSLTIP